MGLRGVDKDADKKHTHSILYMSVEDIAFFILHRSTVHVVYTLRCNKQKIRNERYWNRDAEITIER